MDLDLVGKTALVTGASQGIGKVVAESFAAEGVHLHLPARNDVALGRVKKDIEKNHDVEVSLHPLDLTEPGACERLSEAVGHIDILVNNAGIGSWGTNEDTTEAEWDRVMDVNAKGVFLGTKAVVPEMKKAGGGSIVNISSISGIVGQPSIQPVYNASKGAVRIFTKSTAVQYASDAIRANSVHPGPIDTDMIHERITGPENEARIRDMVPLGRPADPIEVAYGVLFLASDESSYCLLYTSPSPRDRG